MRHTRPLIASLLMTMTVVIFGCGSEPIMKFDSYSESFDATAYLDGIRIDVDSYNKEKLFEPMVRDVFEEVMNSDKEKIEKMTFKYDTNTNMVTEVESGTQYDFNADEYPDVQLEDASFDYDSVGITGNRGSAFISLDKETPYVKIFVSYKVYNETDEMDVTSDLTTVYTFR